MCPLKWIPPTTLAGSGCYCHFTDEETQAQSHQVTHWWVTEPVVERLSGLQGSLLQDSDKGPADVYGYPTFLISVAETTAPQARRPQSTCS